MKTVGIIGGMSWESTSTYYKRLNQLINKRLGGLHSAEILLASLDFAPIEEMQSKGDWDAAKQALIAKARQLEKAGAESIVIATNTMHKVAPQIEDAVKLPLLHIVDAVAEHLKQNNVNQVGLLGTRFTMQQPFYRERLEQQNIKVLIPGESDGNTVDNIIFKELCHGQFTDSARKQYLRIIEDLAAQGAQGVILGCTEIGLLVQQEHSALPLFDTTELHCRAIADWMLD
ncbi:aspartate/glutamate racemase family protein [Idiomarina abyssalis]|uniref:Aspartate/glutamate racemase family protein n=1 Tax=Idiomarina abyssalis TaxID=86102 RepID=A0A8I1KEL3_9GAMM|nr:aspartate/glutamate racemase family protein [Idiomarina abyssalis]MBJ7267023.1 aspartate/glutamate racemase family protein [Idiomarina abyssalis]MBJ7273702.1 aspartate/glutamate racemase family protein [Idiomarina abyssalis]MBJ7316051.1 aspartate/glutamate racemase family protein [Idiomarina abyssalis]